jgi:hypothetical protein
MEGDQNVARAGFSGDIVVATAVGHTSGLVGFLPVHPIPAGCMKSPADVNPGVVAVRLLGIQLGVNADIDYAGAVSRPSHSLLIASVDEPGGCLVRSLHGAAETGPENWVGES